jgi:hypothetical protein
MNKQKISTAEQKMDDYISLKQAGEISGYHPDYLSSLIRSEKLPGKKIGKTWMTTEKAIRDYLATKEYTSVANYFYSFKIPQILIGLGLLILLGSAVYLAFQPAAYQRLSGDWGTKVKESEQGGAKITTYADDNGNIEISTQPK